MNPTTFYRVVTVFHTSRARTRYRAIEKDYLYLPKYRGPTLQSSRIYFIDDIEIVLRVWSLDR